MSLTTLLWSFAGTFAAFLAVRTLWRATNAERLADDVAAQIQRAAPWLVYGA